MMKQSQIKVLNDELRSASWIQSSNIASKRFPRTKAVKVAERVVKRHETLVRREASKLETAYNKLKSKARHAIYFGTEKQAMLAIRATLKFYMDHS